MDDSRWSNISVHASATWWRRGLVDMGFRVSHSRSLKGPLALRYGTYGSGASGNSTQIRQSTWAVTKMLSSCEPEAFQSWSWLWSLPLEGFAFPPFPFRGCLTSFWFLLFTLALFKSWHANFIFAFRTFVSSRAFTEYCVPWSAKAEPWARY